MADLLIEEWSKVALDLGIEIQYPFSLSLESGHRVDARLLIKSFGSEKGMTVISDYPLVRPIFREILAAGYGISIQYDPSPEDLDNYHRAETIKKLREWGWYGSEDLRPEWCTPWEENEEENKQVYISFIGHRYKHCDETDLVALGQEFPDAWWYTGGNWIRGEAIGFDYQVESFARMHEIENWRILPNYEEYGDEAPLMRIQQLIEWGDLLIALYDGRQYGETYLTIKEAQALGKEIRIWTPI